MNFDLLLLGGKHQKTEISSRNDQTIDRTTAAAASWESVLISFPCNRHRLSSVRLGERINSDKREELAERCAEVEKCRLERQSISNDLPQRRAINQARFDLLKDYIQKLTMIRQQWIDDLSRHIFPIERVLTIEEFVTRNDRRLSDPVRSFV